MIRIIIIIPFKGGNSLPEAEIVDLKPVQNQTSAQETDH